MYQLAKRADQVRVTICEAQGDDPAAVVVLEPITPAMRRRALRAIQPLLAGATQDEDVDPDVWGDVGEKVSRELMRLGIAAVEGIAGDDGKTLLELTPDRDTRFRTANQAERPTGTVDVLLADEFVFALLDEGYVRPDAVRRTEKNGLSGLPPGTGTAATPAKDIASSPASRKRKAAAKRAPTAKTSRRPKRAKASGRS